MKRYHKKTRTGCDICRRRRVKCDEATPICVNCSKRRLECHYSSVRPAHTSPSSTPRPSSPQDPQTNRLVLSRSPSRLRELELMQRWCTRTCLCTVPEFVDLLRGNVVHKALQNSHLMDSILAISSLHIATEAHQAPEACENAVAALHYQNQSIVELRAMLRRISRDNCEAILLTCILNLMCALLAPLLPTMANCRIETMANTLLRVRHHTLGINSILEHYAEWMSHGSLAAFFHNQPPLRIGPMPAFVFETLQLLDDAISVNVPDDTRLSAVMRDAVERLEMVLDQSNGTSIFPWLLVARREFLEELEQGESVALVLVMCWGALLHRLDQVWWATYAGRRIVEELSLGMETCEGEWSGVTQWCLGQVQPLGKHS